MDSLSVVVIFIITFACAIWGYSKSDVVNEIMNEDEIDKCLSRKTLHHERKFIMQEFMNMNKEFRIVTFAILSSILLIMSRLLPQEIVNFSFELSNLISDKTFQAYLTILIVGIIGLYIMTVIKNNRLLELKKRIHKRIEILDLNKK